MGVPGHKAETHWVQVGVPTDSPCRSAGTAGSASVRVPTAAVIQRHSRAWAKAAKCVGTASGVSRAARVLPRRGPHSALAVEAAVQVAVVSAGQGAVVTAGEAAVAAVAGGDDGRGGPAMSKEVDSISTAGSFEGVQMMLSGEHSRCHLGVWLATTLAALLVHAVLWNPSVCEAAAMQKHFASAEDGVQALITAAKAGDLKSMLDVLGAAAQPLVTSRDPVVDRNDREHLANAYEESHSLVMSNDRKAVLQVGKDDWPLPIPLVKDADGWRFDTRAGQEEILNRRIGRNELAVIEVRRAYVDAQREYNLRNPQGDTLLQYAQQFASTDGERDGLYWATKPGDEASPLGPLVADARGEGYRKGERGKPIPYHGYYYRILKAQGRDAPGGSYDYVVNGKMMGGFALVAYPASWGNSGVMTFIVNHDGVVY